METVLLALIVGAYESSFIMFMSMLQVNFIVEVPGLGLATYFVETGDVTEQCSISTVSYYNLDSSIDDEYVTSLPE